jgi:hypothetical protein
MIESIMLQVGDLVRFSNEYLSGIGREINDGRSRRGKNKIMRIVALNRTEVKWFRLTDRRAIFSQVATLDVTREIRAKLPICFLPIEINVCFLRFYKRPKKEDINIGGLISRPRRVLDL